MDINIKFGNYNFVQLKIWEMPNLMPYLIPKQQLQRKNFELKQSLPE